MQNSFAPSTFLGGGFGRPHFAAEVSPWHCCNRDFRSESELERHKSEHAKCWVADCPFTASQELIELHFVHQHRTGLANQILQADCDTWRAKISQQPNGPKRNDARRRRERRAANLAGWAAEAAAAGEDAGPAAVVAGVSIEAAESESDDDDAGTRNAGVDNPDGKTEMLIGDVEDPEADAPPTVLSSLAANYASSASMSADSTEADLDDSIEKEKDKQRPEGGPVESLSCGQSRRHVDAALMLHRRRERLMQEPAMRLRRPALLEMLLSRHIRHERNLLFQCVRYVCSTDFLNSDAPTIDKSAAPAHRTDAGAAAETDDAKVDDAAPEFDCDDVEWEAADEEADMATDEDGDEAGCDEASS
uniref:C2H2-type domain-containing protein n=1 Tax=Macrostomum lignano TaxID=282301 RepID=A0A1I8GX92_9PLAT